MMQLAGKSAAKRRHIRTLAKWLNFPIDLEYDPPEDSDDDEADEVPEPREVLVYFLYRMLSLEFHHTELASMVEWEDI